MPQTGPGGVPLALRLSEGLGGTCDYSHRVPAIEPSLPLHKVDPLLRLFAGMLVPMPVEALQAEGAPGVPPGQER